MIAKTSPVRLLSLSASCCACAKFLSVIGFSRMAGIRLVLLRLGGRTVPALVGPSRVELACASPAMAGDYLGFGGARWGRPLRFLGLALPSGSHLGGWEAWLFGDMG